MNMIEDPDLLDAIFAAGQLFSLLLLLFGAYLSTLEPVLGGERCEEGGQDDKNADSLTPNSYRVSAWGNRR
jgi:hypothetical protein